MCYRLGPKFFIQKDSRPFRFKGREPVSPVLPPYFTAVSRQLPLSVSKISEYPDAVTFVSTSQPTKNVHHSSSAARFIRCATPGCIRIVQNLHAPLICRLLSVRVLYVYLFPSKPFSMFHSINGDSKSVKTSAFRFFIYF